MLTSRDPSQRSGCGVSQQIIGIPKKQLGSKTINMVTNIAGEVFIVKSYMDESILSLVHDW